jgi:sulfur carrier protein ThiS adenylyltransferase
MQKTLTKEQIEASTDRNTGAELAAKLRRVRVGISGLGGLGSVVALSLARAGVCRFILADFDRVELSNMNRQLYCLDQIGRYKTDACEQNMLRINPYIEIKKLTFRLTADNVGDFIAGVDVVAECFDNPEAKQMIVETTLSRFPEKYIVAASGLAGMGRSNLIKTRKISEKFQIVGDGESTLEKHQGLFAARVGIAANHQANAIIELINEVLFNGITESKR